MNRVVVCSSLAALLQPVAAHAADDAPWRPSTFLVQLGTSQDAETWIGGATWDWTWQRQTRAGTFGGHWEATLGRWRARHADPDGAAMVTQLGVVPALRWRPARAREWFVEAALGVHWLAPIYRTRDKQFSTVFNFAEHVALGRCLGARCAHELALRVEHVSNANIRRPNPGETFVQLRYAFRL